MRTAPVDGVRSTLRNFRLGGLAERAKATPVLRTYYGDTKYQLGNFGLVKRASVRMGPSVRHFENLTLWIPFRLGLRDRAWKATNGHSRKLAQLSMTIFSKFWSRGRYPVCIHGFRPRCFYLHRGTSHIGSCWHVFSGRAALGLSFRERERGNGEICPFGFEDNVLLTRGSRLRYF